MHSQQKNFGNFKFLSGQCGWAITEDIGLPVICSLTGSHVYDRIDGWSRIGGTLLFILIPVALTLITAHETRKDNAPQNLYKVGVVRQ